MDFTLENFEATLKNMETQDEFLVGDDDFRQQTVRHAVEIFSEANPSQAERFKDVAANSRLRFLRDNGLGRHVADSKSIVSGLANLDSSLSFNQDGRINFKDDFSDEDKLNRIESLRDRLDEAAKKVDYLNGEDLSFGLGKVLDNEERFIRGGDTGFAMDKVYRALDGAVGIIPGSDVVTNLTPDNPEFDGDFTADLASGAGDLVGQSLTFLSVSAASTPAGGTAALTALNANRKYQENYKKAIDLGLSSDEAVDAGLAALPGSVIETFGDRLIAGKFLKASQKARLMSKLDDAVTETAKSEAIKRTIKDFAKEKGERFFKEHAPAGLKEGVFEVVGDATSQYGGYLATGYDEFKPTQEEALRSFLVGSVLGSTASFSAEVISNFNSRSPVEVQKESTQEALSALSDGDVERAAKAVAKTGTPAPVRDGGPVRDNTKTRQTNENEQGIQQNEVDRQEQAEVSNQSGEVGPAQEVREELQENDGAENLDVDAFDRNLNPQESELLGLYNKRLRDGLDEKEEQSLENIESVLDQSDIDKISNMVEVEYQSESIDESLDFLDATQEERQLINQSLNNIAGQIKLAGEDVDAVMGVLNIRRNFEGQMEIYEIEPVTPPEFEKVPRPAPEAQLEEYDIEELNEFHKNKIDERRIEDKTKEDLNSLARIYTWENDGNNLDGRDRLRKSELEISLGKEEVAYVRGLVDMDIDTDAISNQLKELGASTKESESVIREAENVYKARRAEGDGDANIEDLFLEVQDGAITLKSSGRKEQPVEEEFEYLNTNRTERNLRSRLLDLYQRQFVDGFMSEKRLDLMKNIEEEIGQEGVDHIKNIIDSYPKPDRKASRRKKVRLFKKMRKEQFGPQGLAGKLDPPPPPVQPRPGVSLDGLRESFESEQADPLPDLKEEIFRAMDDIGTDKESALDRLNTLRLERSAEFSQIAREIDEMKYYPRSRAKDAILGRSLFKALNDPEVDSDNQAIKDELSQIRERNLKAYFSALTNSFKGKEKEFWGYMDGDFESYLEDVFYSISKGSVEARMSPEDVIARTPALQRFSGEILSDPLTRGILSRASPNPATESSYLNAAREILGGDLTDKLVTEDRIKVVNDPLSLESASLRFLDDRMSVVLNTAHTDAGLESANIEHELAHAAMRSPEIAPIIQDIYDSLSDADKSYVNDFVNENYSPETAKEEILVQGFEKFRSQVSPKLDRGKISSLVDRVKDFFRRLFGLSPSLETLSERVLQVGIENLSRGRVDNAPSSDLRSVPKVALNKLLSKANSRVKNPTKPTPKKERKPSVKGKLEALNYFEGAKRNAKFLRSFTPQVAEDSLIRNNLLRFYRGLAQMANMDLPVMDQSESMLYLMANFRDSRSKGPSIFDTRESPFDFGQEGILSYTNRVIRDFNDQYAKALVEKYEALGLPEYDGIMDPKEITKWIKEHDLNQGVAKDVDPQLLNQLKDSLSQSLEYTPEEYVSLVEQVHGEMPSTFRDTALENIGKVIEEFRTFRTDGRNSKEVKRMFMKSDAFNNFQFANYSEIISREYINNTREKAHSLRGKFKSMFTIRALRGLTKTEKTERVLKRVGYTKDVQDFMVNDFLSPITAGIERSKVETHRQEKEIKSLQDKYQADLGLKPADTVLDDIYLMMSSMLRQIVVDTTVSNDLAFEKNKTRIKKSIQNMLSSPEKKVRTLGEKIGGVYESLTSGLNEDGGYKQFVVELPNRLSYDGAGRGARRVEYLDDVASVFNQSRSSLKFVTEAIRGKAFQDITHYIPTHTIGLLSEKNEVGISSPISEMFPDTYGGSQTQVSETKERSGGIGLDSYYDFNFTSVVSRQIRATNVEIYTAAERIAAEKLLRDDEFKSTIGNGSGENANVIKNRLLLMFQNELHRGDAIPDSIRVTRAIGRQISKGHLSGLHQFISQPVTAMMDYTVTNFKKNSIQNLTDAMHVYGTRYAEVEDFLENYNRTIKERSYEQVEFDRSSLTAVRSELRKYLKGIDKATEAALMAPLKLGDGMASRVIWLSEYMQTLRDNGELGVDGRKLSLERPNFQLIAQTNSRVEDFIGPSARANRGELFSDTSLPISFIRQSMFAYAQHLTALGSRLQGNLSDLFHQIKNKETEETAQLIRDTGGVMSQLALFSAIKFGINASISGVIISQIKDYYDDDEGKIAMIEQKIEESEGHEKELYEQELEIALIIRGEINKQKRQKLSGKAFAKSILRDSVSGAHIIFNAGESFLPKLLFNAPTKLERREFNKVKEMESNAIRARIKETRDPREKARLKEVLANQMDTEFIPLLYEFPNNSPLGGMMGASVDALVKPMKNLSGAILPRVIGEEPLNNFDEFDTLLSLGALGLSQADMSRYFRSMQRIEDKIFEKEAKRESRKELSKDKKPTGDTLRLIQ